MLALPVVVVAAVAAVASTCPDVRLLHAGAHSTVRPHQTPAARFWLRGTQTTWTTPKVDLSHVRFGTRVLKPFLLKKKKKIPRNDLKYFMEDNH